MDWLAEYEAELEVAAKAQIAIEDAAWAALPQVEKDRVVAERDAKLAAMADAPETNEEDEVAV